ncbi:hypothetical protein BC941DRAFT_419704 [Chlamydoabsidia padenii]|nr:hypothetical protein BC941DRAFT_419704 [Chlamydoabsidia padenii]
MSQSTTTSTGTLSDLNFGTFFGFDQLNNNNTNSNINSNNNGQDLDKKRKKPSAITSCFHCKKAQLTCDGSRPCQRCIKRDLANSCTDGTQKREKSNTFEEFNPPTSYPQQDHTMGTSFLDTSQLLNFSLADLGFGSETAGLEYGVIGNMLQNPIDLMSAGNTSSPSTSSSTIVTINTSSVTNNGNMTPSDTTTTSMSSPHTTTSSITPSSTHLEPMTSMTFNPSPSTSFPTNGLYSFSTSSNPMPYNLPQQQQQIQQANNWTSPMNKHQPINTKKDNVTTSNTNSRRKGSNGNTPEQVYNSVRKPFNYAEGFHYLIQYVKQKMGRDDLMRISRALALIRPSFLALIMNLTEEDLVFMEKCFQRTLLEYEKLISFSGTPTVVWRRTGEVCLAGKEFSLLTQWTKDALLGKKTYIYELMDNQSAVEYWEQFSTHAFDNTDKACIHSCILRTPQQRPVPCTFCFTIKRDIFDLPSVIVGNVSTRAHSCTL